MEHEISELQGLVAGLFFVVQRLLLTHPNREALLGGWGDNVRDFVAPHRVTMSHDPAFVEAMESMINASASALGHGPWTEEAAAKANALLSSLMQRRPPPV